jgi:hypothetical protein
MSWKGEWLSGHPSSPNTAPTLALREAFFTPEKKVFLCLSRKEGENEVNL